MRKATFIFLTFLLLILFVGVFAFINQNKLIDRFIQRQADAANYRYELLEQDNTIRLVTVGTGSPLPGGRVRSCNAVFVNGKFFIFDIGQGGSRAIENLRLPIDKLDAIFITHWHSDHYMDLPELINRSWLLNRKNILEVYGPDPIDTIMMGISYFLGPENKNRVNHHGSELMDINLALPRTHRILLDEKGYQLVYDQDGITVEAFAVHHEPVSPSLGYRIKYLNKTLVISGDTKKTDSIVLYAQSADILLHEALGVNFLERAIKIQEENGQIRNAVLLQDLLEYHTSQIEAAQIAAAAKVSKLILTHLGPAPENPISRRFYISGMSEIYEGPILLAEDGDLYTID